MRREGPAERASDYEVGEWTVRPSRGALDRGDATRRLQPRVMALLRALADAPGEVVSHDELYARVWGETHVEPGALARCVSELRAALDDRAKPRRYVETVPKRGYRLVAAVRGACATPRPRTVAVLPFLDLSEGGDQGAFVDGLTEELIGCLTGVESLGVVARTSSFKFKGARADVRDIGRELGADQIVEGSVRKSGTSLRITVQLIDVDTGLHVWSQNYDVTDLDVFDTQEDIARRVALRMGTREEELAGVTTSARMSLEAYEHFLIAQQQVRRHTLEGFEAALESLHRAQQLDPEASAPFSLEALVHGSMLQFGRNPEEREAAVRRCAEDALLRRDDSGQARQALVPLACARGQWAEAQALLDEARAVRPGSVGLRHLQRILWLAQGQAERAVSEAERVVQLDPLHPLYRRGLATALLHAERWDDALEQLEHARSLAPDMDLSRVLEAVALWLSGAPERAAERLLQEPLLRDLVAPGEPSEIVRASRDQLQRRTEFPGQNFFAAVLSSLLEDDEATLSHLEAAAASRNLSYWVNVKGWPSFAALRDQTRFRALLEELRLR